MFAPYKIAGKRQGYLPLVVVDVVGIEFVFDVRLLGRNANGYYAQRDDVFGQTEYVLYHFRAVHIGVQTCPDGSETHCMCGEKEVLCGSRDVIDPEIRHLARDGFVEVTTRDDGHCGMIAAARIRERFAESGDDGFVRYDDERPGLFVDSRRRSHGSAEERVDLRFADFFTCELANRDTSHDVGNSLIFHNLWFLVACSQSDGCECKKDEFFHNYCSPDEYTLGCKDSTFLLNMQEKRTFLVKKCGNVCVIKKKAVLLRRKSSKHIKTTL